MRVGIITVQREIDWDWRDGRSRESEMAAKSAKVPVQGDAGVIQRVSGLI
jgi:hypothetical protein